MRVLSPFSKLSKRLTHLAKEAQTVDQAKYAATLIALDRTRVGTADDLVEVSHRFRDSASDF
jgi:hypothetical protein